MLAIDQVEDIRSPGQFSQDNRPGDDATGFLDVFGYVAKSLLTFTSR